MAIQVREEEGEEGEERFVDALADAGTLIVSAMPPTPFDRKEVVQVPAEGAGYPEICPGCGAKADTKLLLTYASSPFRPPRKKYEVRIPACRPCSDLIASRKKHLIVRASVAAVLTLLLLRISSALAAICALDLARAIYLLARRRYCFGARLIGGSEDGRILELEFDDHTHAASVEGLNAEKVKALLAEAPPPPAPPLPPPAPTEETPAPSHLPEATREREAHPERDVSVRPVRKHPEPIELGTDTLDEEVGIDPGMEEDTGPIHKVEAAKTPPPPPKSTKPAKSPTSDLPVPERPRVSKIGPPEPPKADGSKPSKLTELAGQEIARASEPPKPRAEAQSSKPTKVAELAAQELAPKSRVESRAAPPASRPIRTGGSAGGAQDSPWELGTRSGPERAAEPDRAPGKIAERMKSEAAERSRSAASERARSVPSTRAGGHGTDLPPRTPKTSDLPKRSPTAKAAPAAPGAPTEENLSLAAKTEAEAHFTKAEALIKDRRFVQALLELEAAMNRLPKPPERFPLAARIYSGMGEAYFQLSDFKEAARCMTSALQCQGGTGEPLFHLRCGQAQFEIGDLEQARKNLTSAYRSGGEALFEDVDPKYLALARP